MKLTAFLDIQAGGPGSGCNPVVGVCGRPPGSGNGTKTKVGGKFSKQEKSYMKSKGMIRDLSKKPKKFVGSKLTSRSILNTTVKTMQIPGQKGKVTYNYTELRPTGKNQEGKGTRRWSSAPPDKPHSDIGRFHESMKVHVPEENRRFFAYESLNSQEGHGTSVFINKENTSANSSRVMMQEVSRDRHHEITSTKSLEFKSGKQAKSFIKFRYGVDIKWTT